MKSPRDIPQWLGALISGLAILVVWTVVSAVGLVDPLILPSPARVGAALVRLLTPDGLLRDLAFTVRRLTLALLLATLAGVPLGLWFGYQRGLYRFIEGPMHALRSVPAAALFPLLLIVIGVGESSVVALAFYNSVMVVLISTVSGAMLANQRRLQQARSLGLGAFGLVRHVLFWESLPHVLSGVRVAAGYSLALIVAIEMFIGGGSGVGLGRKIFDYQAAYRIPETYAAILLAGLTGLAVNAGLTLLERRLLCWMPEVNRGD